MYLLNADNLGGYGQGPNGGNADIARVGPIGGVWGKTAAWPGNGGYAYVVTASQGGGPGVLQALAWSVDSSGDPTLSEVGTSSDAFGYGSSAPAVTSDGTQSGSATLWTVWSASDAPEGQSGGSESQLRAYNPVPVNGVMQEIWSAPIGVASKFLTPDFSNGRVYVGNINGMIYGFGEPVNDPLTVTPTSLPHHPGRVLDHPDPDHFIQRRRSPSPGSARTTPTFPWAPPRPPCRLRSLPVARSPCR